MYLGTYMVAGGFAHFSMPFVHSCSHSLLKRRTGDRFSGRRTFC